MMVKRLLPIIMAGILVLETPVTAYAANSGEEIGGQTNARITDARLLETTEDGQEETSPSDMDADHPNQDETIADEETSNGDENLSDEEKPDSDENSTEQEEPSTEEPSDTDVSDGDEENPSDEEQDGADGEKGIEEDPDAADDPEITEDIMPQKAVKAAAEGDFTYTTTNGETTVTGYTGNDTELVIPDTLGGQPVVAIGVDAFKGNTTLTAVAIPKTVTSIKESAFQDCSVLTKTELPVNVTSIGAYAFLRCKMLAEVNLPTGLTQIGKNAFKECNALKTITIPKTLQTVTAGGSVAAEAAFAGSGLETAVIEDGATEVIVNLFGGAANLTSVTIPETVTSIKESAFQGCSALTKIELPGNVTSIGKFAFVDCTGLAEVNLPTGLTQIGKNAFERCNALKTITIPKTLQTVTAGGSVAAEAAFVGSGLERAVIEDGATEVIANLFGGAVNLTSVTIPETVTSIKESAFQDCSALMKIELPDGVTAIGRYAFYKCTQLAEVNLPKQLSTLGSSAFQDCSMLKEIQVPKGLESASQSFINSGLETATFEDGMTKIPDSIFAECKKLNSVTMPETVTEIGRSVFESCTSLAVIVMPDRIETIGAYAFAKCSALSEVNLPKSLITLEGNAFQNCTLLKEVQIPKGLKSAGDSFKNSGLETVTFEGGINKIPDRIFVECAKLSSVKMPETVTEIGEEAFESCTGLAVIEMPDSVATIGAYAFEKCSGLTEANLSRGLIGLGGNAFQDCILLKEIQIPKSLKSASNSFKNSGLETVTFEDGTIRILDSLFADCANITSVTIPNTVTEIGNSAFQRCSALPLIDMPDSVVTIGDSAFQGCAALSSVAIPNSVTQIGSLAFAYCTNLAQVTLSRRLISVGGSAFRNCTALTEIEIPKSLKEASGLFEGCNSLKSVTFEEGTEQIRNGLLYNCTGLEEIIIPDTVTLIGEQAFQGCTGLKKIDIPNSVKTVGSSALRGCTALETIELPEGVETVGDSAFAGCTSLADIVIPGSVVTIGSSAFSGCTALPSVTLPDSVTALGDSVFYGCGALVSITLSQNLETIESRTFMSSGLTAVTVPASVRSIGDDAFRNCLALTEVNLVEGVTEIGAYAFYHCSKLPMIVIPDSVGEMGSYVFAECDLLKDVALGTGLTTIPAYAFNLCIGLEEIILPYRIQLLENSAFAKCTALTKITIPRATTEIEDTAIDYSYLAAKLTVRGVRGTYAEEWASERNVNFEAITIPAEEVKLNRTELSLYKRDSAELFVSVKPMDFTDEVVWRSLDETVATVTNEGLVTAVSVGVAKIRVTVGEKELFCEVTVVQPVESIRLDKNNLELEAWETDMLTAEVYPVDALNKDVAWSSSDEKIAVVDENGVVKGLMKGTVQIRATAVDGSNEYDSCTVTVTNNGYLCTSVEELESPHDYLPDCTDFWVYTKEGAEKLEVAFDEMTKVEDGYDYIEIYDGGDKRIGRYTGTQLAGKTIEVAGNTVKIRLITDERGCMWGFKVTSVFDPEGVLESDIPENGKIPEGMWIAGLAKGGYAYTGKAIKPDIRVYDGNRRLKVGTDYTVSYKNNTKANDAADARTAPTITVKGKGNYEKTVPFTFAINKIDLADSSVTATEILLAPNKKVQKAAPTVMFGGKKLGKGRDYDLAYPSAGDGAYKEPGIYDVQVTGKGNFTGAVTVKLNITEKNLIAKAKVKRIPDKRYDNVNKVGDYRVTLSETDLVVYMKSVNEPLKRGEDYDVTYENNDKVGTATAIITGKGNCIGTKRVTFKITGTAISKAAVSGMVATKVYNGEAQTQDIALTVAGTKLDEGTDYTVTYAKNRDVGKASVTIVGIGKYTGTIKKTFQITAYELKDSMIAPSGNGWKVKYVKGGCKPAVTLEFRDQNGRLIERLTEGVDYKLSYQNNSIIANASARKAPTITINGKGNFKGKLTQKFTIEQKALNDSREAVIMTVADVGAASGRGKYISKPVLTDVDGKALKANTDYTVEYRLGGADGTLLDNKSTVEVGKEVFVTVVGKGKYHGTLTGKYRVAKNKFQSLAIAIDSQEYTGREIRVAEKSVHVKVKKSDKDELTMGTHFEIVEDSYKDNVKKGTAKVTIRGRGDYGGEKTVTFKINTKKILFE